MIGSRRAGERHVANQRDIIEHLREHGYPIEWAEKLHVCMGSKRLTQRHLSAAHSFETGAFFPNFH
jgi:hypothetical protein